MSSTRPAPDGFGVGRLPAVGEAAGGGAGLGQGRGIHDGMQAVLDGVPIFFLRVRSRRGQHVAAGATARQLAVVIWHLLVKGESYVWARPSLHAKKLRDLELKAGSKAARGQKGTAHAYNLKSHRDEERRWVEQAETAYTRFVAGWNRRGPKKVRTGAAKEERL